VASYTFGVPDVYISIAEAEPAMIEELVRVLELRAADPQQQAMRDAYFSDLGLADGARAIEVGCGTGGVTRALAAVPETGSVIGVDPSPGFLTVARELSEDIANLEFVEGDAKALPFEDGSFDAVVFHTTLCHVPDADVALDEAFRVLGPGGRLAVFDGDYATVTCATGGSDPLQAFVDAMMESHVYDRWFARRLPKLVADAGFEVKQLRGHSYVEAPSSAGYMLALVDRGAAWLTASATIGEETAEAMRAEARRRSDAGEFFGHIAYVSVVACKPA
jgi:ubiquinone/menaquinone biosynthesis C-methylase UbiE